MQYNVEELQIWIFGLLVLELFDSGHYWLTWSTCSHCECLMLQIRDHRSTLLPLLCFFCNQHSFHSENQPFWYFFHKNITSQHVSFTWQDFACITTFKRQLQTNKTMLVLVGMYAYAAAGWVLHILQVLKTLNLLIEMTRDNPYSLRLSNPSQLTASLFGF